MNWDELQPILARRLWKRWHNAYNADDLIQIGMVEAWRTYDRLAPDVDLKYLTWKAHLRIKDACRAEYKHVGGETHPKLEYGSTCDDHSQFYIPEDYKQIAELLSQGLTIPEIAEQLGISHALASRRIQKLRNHCHAKLPNIKLIYLKGDITPRQFEILALVAQGYSHAHIAEKLFISARTVGWHLDNLYRRYGSTSALDLILKLIGAGYVRIEQEDNDMQVQQ